MLRTKLALSLAVITATLLAPTARAQTPVDAGPRLIDAIAQQREAKQWLQALQLINAGLARSPGDQTLYRLQALTLADNGNLFRAWQLYQAHPDWFKPAERERLELGNLARRILWSRVPGKDEASDLDEANRTRVEVDAYLARTDLTEEARTRTRIDRLLLLDRQRQYPLLIEEYQSLTAAGHDIPAYALPAAGNAYLAMKQPERAEALYRQAIESAPDDHELRIQHAYSLIEGERFDEAYDLLWHLREREPIWLNQPGSRTYTENWNRYATEDTYYMIRSFGEELKLANGAYGGMASIGPANSGLQESLGSVYMRRGWDTRALERFRMAETLDPRDYQARIGQVDALMSLQRYDLAAPIHDTLLSQRAGNPYVGMMNRRYLANRGWEIEARYAGGRNKTEAGAVGSPLGSRDGEAGISFASALLDDRWRIVGGWSDRWADYPDGRSRYRQGYVGARYAFGRLWSQLSVTGGNGDNRGGSDTGIDWETRWRFSDTLDAGVRLARNDGETPMQARAAGIDSDSATVGLTWTPSDLGQLASAFSHARFSDGNRRNSAQVNGSLRLLTRPHLLIDGKAGLYASRNSLQGTPYFNPSSDHSATLGLRVNHLIWRRYERLYRQILDLDAGPYWQAGYGSAWVPSVSYRHEWKPADRWTLGYGVNWSRPVYDGQRETRTGFDLYLRWGRQ